MNVENEDKTDIENVYSRLNALERRVVQLESELGITPVLFNEEETSQTGALNGKIKEKASGEELSVESQIGGFGLALLGNIVFLFGIIFLNQYIHNNGYPLAAAFFGYMATAGIYLLSFLAKKRLSHLSSMFNIVGQVLLFYTTLRLHYFIDNPVISDEPVALVMLFIVVIVQLVLAYRRRSELYAAITIVLTLATGVISSSSLVVLLLGPVVAAVSALIFFRFGWRRVFMLSIFFVYLNFIAWFLKYPFSTQMAHSGMHQFCFVFLLVSAAILSLVCFAPQNQKTGKNFVLSAILTNGIIFSLVLVIYVMTYLANSYTWLFIIISVYCLIYAVILKSRSMWEFSPALYALYGFVAMSVAIYGFYKLPYTFLFSSLQSLLVLAFAIWFRSRIIATINTLLFVMLLLAYLVNSNSHDSINMSFTLAAFVSSLVIERKKLLLKIETDWLPYTYLVIFFLVILFTLFKLLPPQYITLSWTIVAIVYFIYSIVARNVRFRWMAIFTMISAAFYLFLVDLSRISLAYRIIAFLFLAIISISISVYYSRAKKAGDKEEGTEGVIEN